MLESISHAHKTPFSCACFFLCTRNGENVLGAVNLDQSIGGPNENANRAKWGTQAGVGWSSARE